MRFYDPLDKFYKSQIGAVKADTQITFRVKGNFGSVLFVLRKDGENIENKFEMNRIDDYYELSISFESGLYFYYFQADENYISLNDNYLGEPSLKLNEFQLTVFDSDYEIPNWLYGGIIYQIFPDRFCRSNNKKCVPNGKVFHENWFDTPVYNPNSQGKVLNNDFFGGDIQGIISKLSYLKDLGVTAIYLNPIFTAYSNHRYDTGDYMSIDSLLGSVDDFKALIDRANELGIKLILDGVFNHTGDDSIYFNKYNNYASLGAYQSKDSPYYDWFNFSNYPNEYESWWGITTLPSVNESSESFINFITGKDGVIQNYTKMGIGGWRLDVVDELPAEFVKKIRKSVKDVNSQATIIGEVWEDASNKISYGVRREYFQGKELDSVMNYPLKNAIIEYVKTGDSKCLSKVVKEQIDHYPNSVVHNLMNILSTHDTARLLTVLGGKDMAGKTKDEMAVTFIDEKDLENAKAKLKIASLLQFTLCGTPCIYYGDEIGMQGYIDPLNRRAFAWGNEDKEILDWYKFLGYLRSNYSAFEKGEYKEIYADSGAFVFSRCCDECEILVAVNSGCKTCKLEFDGELFNLVTKSTACQNFVLYPLSIAVFIKKII